nr:MULTISPECIES: restriction endonuclease subunit S [unclassified Acinetobacter]
MASPKLRFKEFDGDWKKCLLKDFVIFSKGKGISKADISEDGVNLCIRYGELYTTYGQVIDKVVSKTNIAKSDSVLSKANDVIIPASGETQIDIATASCVLQEGVILSGDLNILSHQENGEWLAYYLSSAKKQDISTLAQGNSVVHLYSSQLKDLKINKPSKEEQTQIASFLSAVDEKIAQLTQKHELLSQYKQGMMQKLFSQQIRFKADDGSAFGEWENKKLGDICAHFQSGKTITSASISEVGDYPVYGGNGLRGFTDSYTHEGVFALIGRQGALCGNINLVNGKTFISEHAIAVQTNINSSTEWLSRWLDFMKLNRFSESSAQAGLAVNKLVKFDIAVPCLEEQTKIANFLSAIDQKIEVVAQQIEQAKQWKKGLLQQMFV